VGVIVAVPDRAQTIGYLTATQVDGSNHTKVYFLATQVVLQKRIATVQNNATVNYTHVANGAAVVIYKWDTGGMAISSVSLGGTLPEAGVNANTDNAQLGTTLETGSLSGGSQFSGEILFNGTFDTMDQAVAFIKAKNWADTSNL
jgi:hypothetical protein